MVQRVLITGAGGFVGKNLMVALEQQANLQVLAVTRDTAPETLAAYCGQADFVFHLAGVNRTADPEEFVRGNVELTRSLLEALEVAGNPCPVLLASSIHAAGDTPYGKSKRAAEELLQAYSRKTAAEGLVYRLPNLFGKWSRPHYNSVVATFCHTLARGGQIQVTDPDKCLEWAYIDDVITEFLGAMIGKPCRDGEFCRIPVTYRRSLGTVAALLTQFRDSALWIPALHPDSFEKKLYSTFVSYLPEVTLCRDLPGHADSRGSFSEWLKTEDRGQVSISVTAPGVTRGKHWHHSKWERFTVVSGRGRITLRDMDTGTVAAFDVSGARMETVTVPPGYVHSLTNLSDTQDLVTLIWANEAFDPERPDTFPGEVE